MKFDAKNFDLFIPGFIDTIQSNGLKVRAIYTRTLTNGFKLVSSDSLVKVQSYNLTFDDRFGNLYTKPSIGDKILDDDQTMIVNLGKIKDATIITIDNIKIQYQGTCYRLNGQVYLAR